MPHQGVGACIIARSPPNPRRPDVRAAPHSASQRAQNPLIQESCLNHIRDPSCDVGNIPEPRGIGLSGLWRRPGLALVDTTARRQADSAIGSRLALAAPSPRPEARTPELQELWGVS